MRNVVAGLFGGVVLTVVVWQLNDQAHGQPAPMPGNGAPGSVLVVPLTAHDAAQNVAVVDTQTRVLGIYAVDQMSGRIRLTSVRRFRWDLQLDEYNSMEPTAKEIRALIENH